MKDNKTIHKIKKIAMAFCFTILMVTGGMLQVHAAEYEIVFKAGAHGTIQGMRSVSYQRENGDIFPDEPTVVADSGYAFDGWSKQLPAVGSTVQGKEVYVARYITLVDGVEYRVRYVDENGVDIATQKVSITENGHTITERARILAGYQFDQAEKSIQASTVKNEIVFVYTLIDEQAATTNPPVVTVTEAQNQTGNPVNPDTQTPNVNPNPAPAPDVEQVVDDLTPQGDGEVEQVEDNQTPLAVLENDNMVWLIGAGGIVLIGVFLLALARKRKKGNQI